MRLSIIADRCGDPAIRHELMQVIDELVDLIDSGIIEIEFATGGRLRITGLVPAPTVTAMPKALARGKRRRWFRVVLATSRSGMSANQLCRVGIDPDRIDFAPAILDPHVLPIPPAQRAQNLLESFAAAFCSTPTRGTRSICCAPAAIAQAAAPPRSVMTSRRRMCCPFRPTITAYHIAARGLCCASQQKRAAEGRSGSSASD
jgi:hypothetical protein